MIGVNVSSFSFKEKNKKNAKCIPFDSNFSCLKRNCPYTCNNVIELLETFYNLKISPEKTDSNQKYFKTKKNSFKVEKIDGKVYVCFDVCYGSYGTNSEITNIDTNEVEFNKKSNYADVNSFRVMFAFSEKKANYDIVKGVVLFQVIGHYGVKSVVNFKLKEFLSLNFNVTPLFLTVSNREVIKQLMEKCKFKQITLIKNEPQAAFTNIWGINCGKETKTYLLGTIKEKEKFVDIVTNLVTSKNQVYEIIGDYDDVSFTVENNGRTKTISVNNLDSINLVETLPDDVLDNEGKTITSKIDNYMREIAKGYLNEMVEGVDVLV